MESGVVSSTGGLECRENCWDRCCSDGNESSSLWVCSGVEVSIIFENEPMILFSHCDPGYEKLREVAATVSEIVGPESDLIEWGSEWWLFYHASFLE